MYNIYTYKHTKGTSSFDFISHGHHHVIHGLRLQTNISRCLVATPKSHNL